MSFEKLPEANRKESYIPGLSSIAETDRPRVANIDTEMQMMFRTMCQLHLLNFRSSERIQ